MENNDVHEEYALRASDLINYRSAASKTAAEKQALELIQWANEVKIAIGPFPKNLKEACQRHLISLSIERGWAATPFLSERRIVSMLRHQYTSYHILLDELTRKPGRSEAYRIIRKRINEAVCAGAGIVCTPDVTGDAEEEDWLKARWGEQGQNAA